MALPTNYKNDVLNTLVNTKRKYQMINNADGTVSFDEKTTYTQQGSTFGANEINAITLAVNEVSDKATSLNTSVNTINGNINTINGNISTINSNISTTNSNVSNINSQLTSGSTKFRFSVNGEGKYGYLKADGSFAPFRKGGNLIASEYFSPVGLVDRTYTIPEDGFLWVTANNVNTIGSIQIFLNGKETSDYGTSTSGEGNYMSLKQLKGRQVKKGDTVRIFSDNKGSGSHRCNYFIILLNE